jgi:hypothetical protein
VFEVLEKITNYVYKGELIDITHLKIYFDHENKQYRTKFFCKHCGCFLECRCFSVLPEAVKAVKEGIMCYECLFSYCSCDFTVHELLDCLDKERSLKVYDFITNQLTEREMRELIKDTMTDFSEISAGVVLEVLENDSRSGDAREFIVSLMTPGEKQDLIVNTCDFCDTGYSCDI